MTENIEFPESPIPIMGLPIAFNVQGAVMEVLQQRDDMPMPIKTRLKVLVLSVYTPMGEFRFQVSEEGALELSTQLQNGLLDMNAQFPPMPEGESESWPRQN